MGNEVVNFFLPVSQTINAINIVTTLAEGKPLVEPFDPFISGLSRGIAFDVQPGIGVVLGGAIGASIAVGRVKIAAESLPESEIKCIYCRRDLPNITKWEQLGTTYMDDRLTHVYYDGKYYRFEGSDEYWCSNDTPRKRKQKEVLKLLSEEARKEKKKELENTNELLAYSDDLDYLVDHFKVIELRIKAFLSNLEEQDSYKFTSKKSQKTTLRELRSSEKNAYKKCVARIEITKQGKWLPRLERLVIKRHLDEFEKWVILTLIGCIISVDIIKSAGLQNRYRDAMTVGEMLGANCLDLRAQIKHRKYFYKTATLVKENIIKVHESRLLHNSDLMHSCLEIDRRMVDYCVALDTEFGALVEGSSLYTPNVTLEQVVLAKETKQLILDTIEGMEQFRKIVSKFNHNTNANTNANYIGNGVVLLFHGISGTGKTMMANAIANHLKRKILLINYTKLSSGGGGGGVNGNNKAEELLKLSFREAKIQNAVIFFDECEGLFESRDLRGNKDVNAILNSIEKYDDIILLATNRPFDLDEAMYRRIHLAVEFPAPDVHLREKIWRQHIPKQVKLYKNVNLYLLSTEYELTGGFIRNAVMTALKNCLLRKKKKKNDDIDIDIKENDELILTQNDLQSA
eukprot:262825_1